MQMRVGGSVKTQLSKDRNLLVWRWRHVSAVLGHLHLAYVHVFSPLLLMENSLWPEDGQALPKHFVIVKLINYDHMAVVFWRTHPPSQVSHFCPLYRGIESESNHSLSEREENCKFTFLTTLGVCVYTFVCVHIVYICINTHTNILKLLKKYSRLCSYQTISLLCVPIFCLYCR